MRRKTLAWTMALVLGGALLAPATRAGDQEWAVAGKVLTGIAALHLLTGMAPVPPPITLHPPVPPRVTVHSSRSRGHSYHRSSCSPQVSYRTHRKVYYRPAVVQRRQPAHCGTLVAPHCDNPVVVHMDGGRRIYQPRIHGHQAYMQIWSDVSRSWVTLKLYPSIY